MGYTTPKAIYTYSEARNDPSNNQPYQNNGRLTTLETLENTAQGTLKTIQRYDYDGVGQVRRHRQTIGANEYQLEYGYNLAGQLTSEKYPSGRVVNMTVDNFGVVQSVADAQRAYLNGVSFNYTANGMTSQMTLGNGTTESFTMNERFQLTSQSLTRGSEVVQKYNYNYGDLDSSSNLKNNGKLEQIESFIGSNKQWTQNFRYDSIGRLKEAQEKRGDTNALTYKQVFDFDRFGNLYRKLASNPTTGQQNPLPTSWIEDTHIDKNTNRFTTATGTSYNEAGQVTQDNKFREMGFAYDANGRVVKATRANTPDAHTVYDALGNRVATKINDVWQYMIYDAFGKLVAEYGTASPGMGGVKYVQQDHQGSVRTVTNSNGFIVSRTDHQAFGETISSGVGLRSVNQGYGVDPSTRQGYGLTESDDSTGQQHTWFRKLETQAGRWSSPDPYRGSMNLGDSQSFNRYAYVGNEPTNYVDPSGLMRRISCEVRGVDYEGGGGQWLQCSWVETRWGGYHPPDKPIREPHGPEPPSDPCAGRKGTLNHSEGANRTTKVGIGHISPRHIIQEPEYRRTGITPKSNYIFGAFFTNGSATITKAQRERVVMNLNQEAFDKGGVVSLYGGKAAYVYAPLVGASLGGYGAEGHAVGLDKNKDFQVTNVRTVVVAVRDCATVITSFPGLPSGVRGNNPNIVGTPKWWEAEWSLPF